MVVSAAGELRFLHMFIFTIGRNSAFLNFTWKIKISFVEENQYICFFSAKKKEKKKKVPPNGWKTSSIKTLEQVSALSLYS